MSAKYLSLPLLSGPLQPKAVVHIRVPTMGQMNPFENY